MNMERGGRMRSISAELSNYRPAGLIARGAAWINTAAKEVFRVNINYRRATRLTYEKLRNTRAR